MQIPGGSSSSSMEQRYTDRWDRMLGHRTLVGGCVGICWACPVPASGGWALIGVAMAMATIDLGGTLQLAHAERIER